MELQPIPMHLRVDVLVPNTNWYESLEATLHALRVHRWTHSMIKEWLPGAESAKRMLLRGTHREGYDALERTTRLNLTNGVNRVTLKVTNDLSLMIQRDEERV